MDPLFLPLEKLQIRDRELKAHIAQLGEMRPGSLVECYRKCSKLNCHCARPGDRGHGLLWMVTHAAQGKIVSRAIPSGPALDRTRAQIAEYQRFRKLAHALVATNEQICNARLRQLSAASSPEIKKTALAEGFAAEVEHELEALLGTAGAEELDLEAVETALWHWALRLAGRLLKEHLNADHTDQLNGIWIFDQPVEIKDVVAGRASQKAIFHVQCDREPIHDLASAVVLEYDSRESR